MANPPSRRPIPIPLSQRWRDFRMRLLPIIVVGFTIFTVAGIWREHVAAPTMLGEVAAVRSTVNSPEAGSLANLHVKAFDRVQSGDSLAQVIRTDPRVVEHTLAVIGAEIELIRVGMEPLVGPARQALQHESLRLDKMSKRVDLASAQVRLNRARSEYERYRQLHEAGLVPQDELEALESEWRALETETGELAALIEDLEARLAASQPPSAPEDEGITESERRLQAAIAVQEEELRLAEAQLRPVTVTAPMDGMVSAVNRRTGEHVEAGEPILTISGYESDRIVAYMRQPLVIEPEPGMIVEVRSRGQDRTHAEAVVMEVGPHLEQISETLLRPLNVFDETELGLPLLIALPSELSLRPGEIVDIILEQPGVRWDTIFRPLPLYPTSAQ